MIVKFALSAIVALTLLAIGGTYYVTTLSIIASFLGRFKLR